MKKIVTVFVALVGICSANISHADYCEPGAARVVGGRGGVVDFSCPPPMVTCYQHTGSSQKPTNGDKITLTIGDHQYEGTLIIGNNGTMNGDAGQGGSLVLSGGLTFDDVTEQVDTRN